MNTVKMASLKTLDGVVVSILRQEDVLLEVLAYELTACPAAGV